MRAWHRVPVGFFDVFAVRAFAVREPEEALLFRAVSPFDFFREWTRGLLCTVPFLNSSA